MPPRGPVLTVIITGSTEGLDKGLKEAEGKIGAFGKKGGKIGKAAKVAGPIVAIAAAAAKLGSTADKTATAMKGFEQAMLASGASAEDLAGPLKDAVKSATEMAFTGGQARDSLVALQTATGDAAKSAELLAVAQDVARLSGADLTVAADAIAKAYVGQDRALKALLPGLDPAAKGMDAIAEAERLAAGQAENFAGSAEALGIKASMSFKAVANSIGKAVQPAFRALLEALIPVLDALGQLVNALLPVLVPLVTLVAKVFTKLVNILTTLITNVLPVLNRLIAGITRAFQKVASVIQTVVGWVQKLIDKINALLAPLQKAVDKLSELNPFKGQIAQIVGGQQLTAAALTTTPQATAGGARGGGVVINIYGDPAVIEAKVTKALRDYARRNGAAAVFAPSR